MITITNFLIMLKLRVKFHFTVHQALVSIVVMRKHNKFSFYLISGPSFINFLLLPNPSFVLNIFFSILKVEG